MINVKSGTATYKWIKIGLCKFLETISLMRRGILKYLTINGLTWFRNRLKVLKKVKKERKLGRIKCNHMLLDGETQCVKKRKLTVHDTKTSQ